MLFTFYFWYCEIVDPISSFSGIIKWVMKIISIMFRILMLSLQLVLMHPFVNTHTPLNSHVVVYPCLYIYVCSCYILAILYLIIYLHFHVYGGNMCKRFIFELYSISLCLGNTPSIVLMREPYAIGSAYDFFLYY